MNPSYFVLFCYLSLSLLMISEVYAKSLVLFRLFQFLEISDLAMAKDEEVDIAVTYNIHFRNETKTILVF
jgi:hypothetical protein